MYTFELGHWIREMKRARFACVLAVLAGCSDRVPSAPPPRIALDARAAVAGEEELLGDPLVGETAFYDQTSNGPRARYQISIQGQGHEFYMPSRAYPWGWFTSVNADCSQGEIHDVNGAGTLPNTIESHCLPHGEYTVNFNRATWSADGSTYTTQLLFTRRIAMLNAVGAPNDTINGSPLVNWHDQHVRFDLNTAIDTLSGAIQAGEEIHEMYTIGDLYGATPSFTIAAGDTLWLISTYTAHGSDSRPWYNSVTGVMTAFNPNYTVDPSAFGSSVNSVPNTPNPTKPFLRIFDATVNRDFVVRGRVVRPYQDGTSALGTLAADSITVHAIAPVSCFVHSDTLAAHAAIRFDGSCSSAFGVVERYWDFGDGSNSGWRYNVDTVSHAYSAAGTYTVRLDVRRSLSTSPVVASSQSLQISALVAGISGPDIIWTAGSYTWNSGVVGGVSPYQYSWYYKKGGSETAVGTGASYTRSVSTAGAPYVFRLRLVVQDAQSSSASAIYWVDVPGSGGGAAAATSLGTVDTAGQCRALPQSRAGRTARYEAIVSAGRWPELCFVAARS